MQFTKYSSIENSYREKYINQMYLAAVKYCNKCDIEISYLDNLLAE